MPEDAGDLVDNRQAQPQAAILVRPLRLAALELLEHFAALVRCDADAGIPHLDQHLVAAPPATEHDPPAGGVAHGVAEQVAQDPRQ